MQIETVSKAQIAQEFMASIDVPDLAIFAPKRTAREWRTVCYWPNGDVVRDQACYGVGDTLDAAIADMMTAIEKAKYVTPILKTAAEVKEAVLNLIREHDAAPASFRDAVDALPVKG